jgi:hypothetical protein
LNEVAVEEISEHLLAHETTRLKELAAILEQVKFPREILYWQFRLVPGLKERTTPSIS